MTYLQVHLFFPWLFLIIDKPIRGDLNLFIFFPAYLSADILHLLVHIVYILQQSLNILVIVILSWYLVIPKYVSYVNLVLIICVVSSYCTFRILGDFVVVVASWWWHYVCGNRNIKVFLPVSGFDISIPGKLILAIILSLHLTL